MNEDQEAALLRAPDLKIFRIGNRIDDLPFYVRANSQKEAIGKVEALCGPLPEKLIVVKQITAAEVPEGEEPLE